MANLAFNIQAKNTIYMAFFAWILW